MFQFLVQGGAVPLGYMPDVNGSDSLPYLHHRPAGQDYYHYVRDPLPDIIASNTPPESPLRRTRSCHAFFPDTPPPSPPPPPTSLLIPATPRAEEEGPMGAEGGIDEASLLQLPKLSWPLPQRRPRKEGEGGEEEREVESQEEARRRRWRYIGIDLRNVADQFQFRHSKALETKTQSRRRRRRRRERKKRTRRKLENSKEEQ
ncbi:zinc finger CCCH domain-containing protein 4-like [Portunus trituberculatus]|uniref:zinc finger CCCH domain-containing protein 4-like n=1 Tax=Portunus trituberculatus TaxID=210409 RepID=UPI001E1CD30A|nr:zinc finger CCCH domain-containing protein 4-like [Portunus trituberculatus]